MLKMCTTHDTNYPLAISHVEVEVPKTDKSIEHVSLHAFVRGMKTH
jgi:hypothetical protein